MKAGRVSDLSDEGEPGASGRSRQAPPQFWLAALCGLTAALIWGGWMGVTRVSVQSDLQPADLTALRFLVGGLVLLPVVIRKGLKPASLSWGQLALLGAGAGAPYALIAMTGLSLAPAAHGGVMIPGTMPLFVALIGLWVLGTRIPKRAVFGFVFILLGVLALVSVTAAQAQTTLLLGHALFLIAALFWAVFTLTMRASGLTALHAVAIVSVLSLVLYVVPYFLITGDRLLSLPMDAVIFQGVYQGLLANALAMVLYGTAVTLLGAASGAAFAAMVPVFAGLLAIPIAGEVPGLAALFGMVCVTSGVLLATRSRSSNVTPS